MHIVRSLIVVVGFVWMTDWSQAADPPSKSFLYGSSNFRHSRTIYDAALSADAKLLATVCFRDVMVWDVESGRRLHHFPDCGVPSYAIAVNLGRVAFSQDGRWLVHAMDFDAAARMWDLKTGREVRTFGTNPPKKEAPNSPRTWVAFTPDGAEVTVLRQDRIEFHDVEGKRPNRKVPYSDEIFDLLAFAPDGKTVAGIGRSRKGLGPDPGKLTIVERATGKALVKLPVSARHTGFGPDGSILATLDAERLQIWDVRTGKEIGSMARPTAKDVDLRTDPAFSPDGSVIYIGCLDGSIRRFEWRAGKELTPLSKHLWWVTKILPLPDGKRVLSVGHDGAIRRWDVATGKEIQLPEGYTGTIFRANSPKNDQFAVGDWAGRIDVWDARGSKILRTLRITGPHVGGLAFSPTDGTLASLHWDGRVNIWDPETGKELRSFQVRPAFMDDPRWFLFGQDGRLYLSTEYVKVQAWDPGTGKPLWPQSLDMRNLAIARDGRTIAFTQFGSMNVHLIDPAAPDRVSTMPPNGPPDRNADCNGLAFMTGGQLASVHADGSLRIWDTRQKTESKVLRRDGGYVFRLYTSDRGDWLVTRSLSEWVVWDFRTGTAVDSFSDLTDRMRANGADSADWPDRLTQLPLGWLNMIRPPRDEKWPKAEAAWKALASEDGSAAYRAMCGLLAEPAEAARLFKSQLQPVIGEPAERILKLIAQLDAPRFADREAAVKALTALGPLARPAIVEALRRGPSAEAGERLRKLHDALAGDPSPADVRIGRAILILETAATSEARAVLKEWAGGARGPFQTEAAREAIERLERQSRR